MTYIYTPDDAQSIADVIASFLTKRKYKVFREVPISKDASFRTTLLAKKADLSIMVEAQHKPKLDDSLIALAQLLEKKNSYCEFYVATHEKANFTGTLLKQLEKNGIGLLVVDASDQLMVVKEPKNPALIVRPDPTLKYGNYKEKVNTCLGNFNSPNSSLTTKNPRKEALGDMCDMVEALTKDLALLAVKKRMLKLAPANIDAKDWSGVIDTLASKNSYWLGKNPIISANLRFDLHSFRGARNLLKHPAKSKRQEAERQEQFAERMMMGPRLVADLVSIKSLIAKKKK